MDQPWFKEVAALYRELYPKISGLTQTGLLLWLLARRLGYGGQGDLTSAAPLAGKSRDILQIFDQLDQQASFTLMEAWAKKPLPDPDSLENLYQSFLDPGMRSKTGSYYTPSQLAAFMVSESIRSHYHASMDMGTEERFPLYQIGSDLQGIHRVRYYRWFKKLNLLDLSCGSGVFLRQGLVALLDLAGSCYGIKETDDDFPAILKEVAETKMVGVDAQAESLLLADLLIRLQLMNRYQNEKIVSVILDMTLQLYHGDALTWEPGHSGGILPASFEIILGNPPYAGEKGNTTLFHEARSSLFGQKYYEKNMDFAYYFLHRGLDLLAPGGRLTYLTTSYFSTADGASLLRRRLQSETDFQWLINTESITLFPNAKGQHNLIYCLGLKKGTKSAGPVLMNVTGNVSREKFLKELTAAGLEGYCAGNVTRFAGPDDLFDDRGQMLIRAPGRNQAVLKRMSEKTFYSLQDLCLVNQGLVTGADKVSVRHENMLGCKGAGQGIFVLEEREKDLLLDRDPTLCVFLKPFYKNSQIWPYRVQESTNQWVLYLTDEGMPDIKWYPALEEHLEPYRPVLERRREVQKKIRRWHSLHWPRTPALFERPKLVAPQRASLNVFAISSGNWYASADVYFIQRRNTCFQSLEYLLAWLNSAPCSAWLTYYGKMKGKDLELYATPLKSIPVPLPPDSKEEEWMDNQVRMILEHPDESDLIRRYQRLIDERFMDWLGISLKEGESLLERVELMRNGFSRRQW